MHDQQLISMNRIAGIAAGSAAFQNAAIGQDRSPVERSTADLSERIGFLSALADDLIDRLAPVSRQEAESEKDSNPRPIGACKVSEQLDQATDRLIFLTRRIETARDQLCI